jgi:hypothetical protein
MAAFNEMQKTLAKGLSEVANVIQWGFTEVSWQVHDGGAGGGGERGQDPAEFVA